MKIPFFGGYSEEVTPVPIPNTEVKLFSADGTAREAWWESRTPPKILYKACHLSFDDRLFYRGFYSWYDFVHSGSGEKQVFLPLAKKTQNNS